VLLLQLQRAAHFAGHGAKVQGFVQFPLVLDWTACCQSQQQHAQQQSQCEDPVREAAAQELADSQRQQQQQQEGQEGQDGQEEAEGSQQQQQEDAGRQCNSSSGSSVRQPSVLYDLVAVVQHLGSGHSWGHYIMYRRLTAGTAVAGAGAAVAGARAAVAGARAAVAGARAAVAGGVVRSEGGCSSNAWVRVSDSSVSPVSEGEVLQCHATLLVYERRGQ
jgi:hypothetical protein